MRGNPTAPVRWRLPRDRFASKAAAHFSRDPKMNYIINGLKSPSDSTHFLTCAIHARLKHGSSAG